MYEVFESRCLTTGERVECYENRGIVLTDRESTTQMIIDFQPVPLQDGLGFKIITKRNTVFGEQATHKYIIGATMEELANLMDTLSQSTHNLPYFEYQGGLVKDTFDKFMNGISAPPIDTVNAVQFGRTSLQEESLQVVQHPIRLTDDYEEENELDGIFHKQLRFGKNEEEF